MNSSLFNQVYLLAAIAALVLAVACSNDPSPCGFNLIIVKEESMTPEIYAEDAERAEAIRHKYDDLFWRQPNVHGVGIGIIENENGEYTNRAGFIIDVTKKVDQSTLPPEDRIPDCLEGVPV